MAFGLYFPHLVDETLIHYPSPLKEPDITLDELDALFYEQEQLEQRNAAQHLSAEGIKEPPAQNTMDDDVSMQEADNALAQVSLSDIAHEQDPQDAGADQDLTSSASSPAIVQRDELTTDSGDQDDLDTAMTESQPTAEEYQATSSAVEQRIEAPIDNHDQDDMELVMAEELQQITAEQNHIPSPASDAHQHSITTPTSGHDRVDVELVVSEEPTMIEQEHKSEISTDLMANEQLVASPHSNQDQNNVTVAITEELPATGKEQKSPVSPLSPEPEVNVQPTTIDNERHVLEVSTPGPNQGQKDVEATITEELQATWEEQRPIFSPLTPEPARNVQLTTIENEQHAEEVSAPGSDGLTTIDDLDQEALLQGRPSPITRQNTAEPNHLHSIVTLKSPHIASRKSSRISALQKGDSGSNTETSVSIADTQVDTGAENIKATAQVDHKMPTPPPLVPQKRQGKVGVRELRAIGSGDAEVFELSEAERPKKVKKSTPQIKVEDDGTTRRTSSRLNPPVTTKSNVLTAASTRARRHAK